MTRLLLQDQISATDLLRCVREKSQQGEAVAWRRCLGRDAAFAVLLVLLLVVPLVVSVGLARLQFC